MLGRAIAQNKYDYQYEILSRNNFKRSVTDEYQWIMNWTPIEGDTNQLSWIESIDWQTDYEADMEEHKRSIDLKDNEENSTCNIDGVSPMNIRRNRWELI